MKNISTILPEFADYPIYREPQPLPKEPLFDLDYEYEEDYDSIEDQEENTGSIAAEK